MQEYQEGGKGREGARSKYRVEGEGERAMKSGALNGASIPTAERFIVTHAQSQQRSWQKGKQKKHRPIARPQP